MAAGGFRTFVAGETLDDEKINDFLMQGILVFADDTARDAAITDPVEGQFAFLKDSDQLMYYSGTAWEELSSGLPEFQYLVIGGGGGGGGAAAGGGGAGGYICSVPGETSGGTASARPRLVADSGSSFTVTVGAGGAGDINQLEGIRGGNSLFGPVSALGGGGGGGFTNKPGLSGGSGGGGAAQSGASGAGAVEQGFAGGTGAALNIAGAGGGGAGAVGQNGEASNVAGPGGAGLSSSITGSAVTRAGGGGAGGDSTGSAGGSGGGGAGGNAPGGVATAGTVNTGSGGGGGGGTGGDGAAGGSGLVVLKYPLNVSLTIGGGLTSSTSTIGEFKVTTFTAGTDSVTVSF